MAYNFSHLKEKAKNIEEWLKKEMSGIRTGKAMPAILDSVQVDSYGSKMKITELASVSVEDSKTLRITPWDMSQVKHIEKAIATSTLGLGVSADERGVRVTFPELTSERRAALVKVAKEKLEESRMSLRTLRKDIQAKEKAGGMGEDEKFRLKDEMQKIVDGVGKSLEEMFGRKEKEVVGQ